jgi:hypothetical protein
MPGVFYIIARVYVRKFENGTAQKTADIPQMSLHKHGTITQIIPDIFQTSLHKHGTIKQNTADTPQISLHKHGRITQITFGTPKYVRNDLFYCPVFMK